MHEFEQNINNLRARIAALRSRLGSGVESAETPEVHRIYIPQEGTDISTSNTNTTDSSNKIDNISQVKNAELDALRAKLKGNK